MTLCQNLAASPLPLFPPIPPFSVSTPLHVRPFSSQAALSKCNVSPISSIECADLSLRTPTATKGLLQPTKIYPEFPAVQGDERIPFHDSYKKEQHATDLHYNNNDNDEFAKKSSAKDTTTVGTTTTVSNGLLHLAALSQRGYRCLEQTERTFNFTREELETVLYGYTKPPDEALPGHALSCVQLENGCSRDLKRPYRQINVLDPSKVEVPEGLTIRLTYLMDHAHYGVFCDNGRLTKGTRFGPFAGRVVHMSEIKTYDDNTHMWEVFMNGKLSHFVDGRGPAANWMCYVNNARFAHEQNLIAVQKDGEIYYEVCKDVNQGTELLVWYGDAYLQFFGIPVALKETFDVFGTEKSENAEGYSCERCGKVFAYRYYRDKHLKYTRCVDKGDRKFPCSLCSRSFEKRDRLRIHVLHVHEKHRPHKCAVCSKCFSQSSSLNKHMRVHSGERPYKCVYCSKAFTASSILRTHIRQHSGEKPFKCKFCGKSFASHAAHDSHVRRSHDKERCVCRICGQNFSQPYELKFHIANHTTHVD